MYLCHSYSQLMIRVSFIIETKHMVTWYLDFITIINLGEPGSLKRTAWWPWPRYHQRKFQCRLSWLRFHLYWLQVLQFESWYPTVACGSCHFERNNCWWFRNLANHREFFKPCNTVNNGINYQPQLVSWSRISGCHQNSITWTWITKKGASRGEDDEKNEDWNPTLCCYLDIHGS